MEDGDSELEPEMVPDSVCIWERLSVTEGVIEKEGVDVGEGLVDG